MSSELIMYAGFALAAYSVIGNDVIQTLGTFMASNSRRPWYVLWLFAGGILAITLIYGWFQYGGDPSFGRLIGDEEKGFSIENPRYAFHENMPWWFLVPPAVLLLLTRFGLPVSTTFLVLTFFEPKGLGAMLGKSLLGYAVAFSFSIAFYLLITRYLEKGFLPNPEELNPNPVKRPLKNKQLELAGTADSEFVREEDILVKEPAKVQSSNMRWWMLAQWVATGFLWVQWLKQDFANIYVYLPRQISATTLAVTLSGMLALLGYIFYSKGGEMQKIVNTKINTSDIRSASIIDFCYGLMLFIFATWSKVPMSTTWVFIGLLAGREYGMRYRLYGRERIGEVHGLVRRDLFKASAGLVVSVLLVVGIELLRTGNLPQF